MGKNDVEKVPVKLWSTVGAKLPIPDTYGSISFSFGHERYAKSSDSMDLVEAEADMHEFNLEVLNDRLNEFKKDVRRFTKKGNTK